MKHLILIFSATVLVLSSCNSNNVESMSKQVLNYEIVISKKHYPNLILCDLDGDKKSDSVSIVMSTNNKKYGLKITFGNNKVEFLGLGKEVLGQEFDDLDWVGVFEVAPKGEVYYNNVDENYQIIMEDQVKESDKIRLPNDGIFLHAAEACGGGVIYLKNGKFDWIQQE